LNLPSTWNTIGSFGETPEFYERRDRNVEIPVRIDVDSLGLLVELDHLSGCEGFNSRREQGFNFGKDKINLFFG